MLISFVSAQYYGNFSFSNFLESIGPSTMLLFIVFIISFAFLIFIFQRSIFKENPTIAAVISFALSLGITYGINRSDFNLGGWFYGFGISPDLLFNLLSIFFVILVIYFAVKKQLRYLILGSGLLLIILALFTDLIYERGIALGIGGVLFLIGIWLWNRQRKKEQRAFYDNGDYPGSVRGGRYPREGPSARQRFKDWRDPGRRLEKYSGKIGRLEQKEEAQLEKHKYQDRKWQSRGKRAGRFIGRQRRKAGNIKRIRRIYRGEEET